MRQARKSACILIQQCAFLSTIAHQLSAAQKPKLLHYQLFSLGMVFV